MREQLISADAIARDRAAREFDRHFILEAGAGTGKTTVLVSRFLAWCLGPGFDAATGEEGDSRAARVLESVAALTFSEAAAAEMESRIAHALRELAEGRNAHGMETGAVSPSAGVASRARELLDHCERLQVSTIHAFCRRVLSGYPVEAGVAPHFRIDASGRAAARVARATIERWLGSPRPEDVEDLEALAEWGCGPAALETLLGGLLESALEPEAFEHDPLSKSAIEGWWSRFRVAMEPLAPTGDPEAEGSEAWLEGTPPRDAAALQRRLEALRARWPESLCKRIGRDPDTAGALPALLHAHALEPHALERFRRLLAPRFHEASRQLDLDGVQSFDQLLSRTRDLLDREARVRDQICGSLRQLFVDEFQDTDEVQCEIIASLAFADAGPTLFVVGDPKQSIYGWRSADLGAYDAFLSRLRASGAEHHQLSVSHRSFPEILDEVEAAIAGHMVREEGVQPAFQSLVASDAQRERAARAETTERVVYWVAQEVDPSGEVRTTSSADSLALETRALVADLWQTHRERGTPWQDIAILLRSTGDLDDYLDALRRAGIPYAVDRDRIYFRRREVLEARALLRVLLDPNDDLAWVATLRSARFGLPDAAWLPFHRAGGIDAARRALDGDQAAYAELANTLDDVARDIGKLAIPRLHALDEAGWHDVVLDGLETLVALRRCYRADAFELFLARVRRCALFDLSEGARFLGRYRLANLDRLFREIGELYARSGGDASAVLRELRREDVPVPESEEGRPPTAGGDAVQVMTIHGSKGLDFEQVYLLQSHKGSASRSDAAVAVSHADGELEYRLRWGRRRAEVAFTLGWDRADARRKAMEAAEQIRTLYVAMTRAKSRLVISGRLASGRPEAPRSHADLLAARVSAPPLPGVSSRILGAPSERGAPRENSVAAAVANGVAALAFTPRRAAAAAHAARPYGLAASAAVSLAAGDHEARESGPRGGSGSAAERGAAIGTAIHAFLEGLEIGDDGDAWEGCLPTMRARLANRLPTEEVAAAERDALEVLERFRASPLWDRFREIHPHILGREVPLLSGPGLPQPTAASPVGFHIGAIDLLHRDPETGGVVVVDFKSDRVEDDAALEARAAHYAPQGRVYCDGVADAMGLDAPPRFELWFLAAGRRLRVDPRLPATEATRAHLQRGDPKGLR